MYRGKVSYLFADDMCHEPEKLILQPELLDPREGGIELVDPESSLNSVKSFVSTGSAEALGENCPDGGDPQRDSSSIDSMSQNGSLGSGSQKLVAEEVSGACAQSEAQTGPVLLPCKTTPSGPPTDLLVPLNDPLPSTWVTKDDSYLSVTPLMVPFMSRTVFGDPNLQIGSGKFRLMWVDGSMSKLEALKMFKNTEKGKHVEMDKVKLIDVKAFRIDPITPDGMMTVDGERVSYGPMQAQIHPHLACVMSRKRCSISHEETS